MSMERNDRGGDRSGSDRGDFRKSGGGRGGDGGGREGGRSGGGGRGFSKRKVCRFCVDKLEFVDYKDVNRLSSFVTERGKIVPARISGSCAYHQRQITNAIKHGRTLGMYPLTVMPQPHF